jgi:hypothetical protein
MDEPAADKPTGAQQFRDLHPAAQVLVGLFCAALLLLGLAGLAILAGWLWHAAQHVWS